RKPAFAHWVSFGAALCFPSQLKLWENRWRREGDSNPRYPFEVRRFSKALLSATQPSLPGKFGKLSWIDWEINLFLQESCLQGWNGSVTFIHVCTQGQRV